MGVEVAVQQRSDAISLAALGREVGSLRHRAAALGVISRVTDAIVSEGSLGTVLDGIVGATAELLRADRGSLMLIEPDDASMRIHASTGIPQKVVERACTRVGEGIAGRCAARGEATLIRDIRTVQRRGSKSEERYGTYRTRSAICVPLRVHSQVLGVLNINDRRDGESFNDDDLFAAQIIARQAAVAIANSRLLAESAAAAAARESLEIARSIQQSLIPADLEIPGAKIAARSLACQEAGGDYVDFWTLGGAAVAEGSSLFLAIGDVSGHGVGAALIMATSRAFLRALMSQSTDLAQVMGQLDQLLAPDLRPGNFMTLLIAILDPARGELTYVSAGHDPPLLHHAASGEQCELGATGPPLGVLDDAHFPICQVEISPGDLLIFTTDGVCEARDGQDEMFGRERLGRFVGELAARDPRAIIQDLESRVCAHAHPRELRDDLSLLALRHESRP